MKTLGMSSVVNHFIILSSSSLFGDHSFSKCLGYDQQTTSEMHDTED